MPETGEEMTIKKIEDICKFAEFYTKGDKHELYICNKKENCKDKLYYGSTWFCKRSLRWNSKRRTDTIAVM